jgi:hypothetical protein
LEELYCDPTVRVERMILGTHKTGRRLARSLRLLGEEVAVRPGDDHIHHILDGQEAIDELLERGAVFSHEACIEEMLIAHYAREKNGSQLPEAVVHRLSPILDEVPAQARTGDDENQAEQ